MNLDIEQFFIYLDYVKNVIEFGILISPFVTGFFKFIKKKLHKQ